MEPRSPWWGKLHPGEGGGQPRRDSSKQVLQLLGRSYSTLSLAESLRGHQVTIDRPLSSRGQ